MGPEKLCTERWGQNCNRKPELAPTKEFNPRPEIPETCPTGTTGSCDTAALAAKAADNPERGPGPCPDRLGNRTAW